MTVDDAHVDWIGHVSQSKESGIDQTELRDER